MLELPYRTLPLRLAIPVPVGPIDVVGAVDGLVICGHSVYSLHVLDIEDLLVVVDDGVLGFIFCDQEEGLQEIARLQRVGLSAPIHICQVSHHALLIVGRVE